jgi:two-component system sensor histidine kinase YesM
MKTRLFSFFRNRKLRTKLLLSYIFVVLLPVLLVSVFLINKIKESVLVQTRSIYQISFNQLSDNLYHQLTNYLQLSDDIQEETKFAEYLSTKFSKDNIMEVYSKFTGFLEAYSIKFGESKEITRISFITSNDTLLYNERYVYPLTDKIENMNWYKAAVEKRGSSAIGLYYSEDAKQYYLTISRLMSAGSTMDYINVLKMEIPENELYKLMQKEGENKRIYILDQYNNIISTTDRANIEKNIADIDMVYAASFDKNGNKSFYIENGNEVAYVYRIDNKSAIDGWKIVSVISSTVLMKEINNIVTYGIIINGIIIMITIVAVVFLSETITNQLKRLLRDMNAIRNGYFKVAEYHETNDEIGELTKGFREMVNRIDTLIEDNYKAELSIKGAEISIRDLTIRNKEAEIRALQSQINPHFLFNTMESIRMDLLRKKDLETATIIQNFGHLLRKSFNWSEDVIPLRQEIGLVELYMKIQKYQYKDRINYIIDVDESILDYCIPKFTLQPIVENAIYHGLEMKNGVGTVTINSTCSDDEIRLIIQDDGIGMDRTKLDHMKETLCNAIDQPDKGHIGIVNVHQRLRLHYGDKYGIDIQSEVDKGTRVVIVLPKNNMRHETDVQRIDRG